jgi:hypothetical protein
MGYCCFSIKACEGVEDSNSKRMKTNEGEKIENGKVKAEEDIKGGTNSNNGGDEKQNKSNIKPPEAPKDYIHVRARRGQATDSHSLAERVRIFNVIFISKLSQTIIVLSCSYAVNIYITVKCGQNIVVAKMLKFVILHVADRNLKPC